MPLTLNDINFTSLTRTEAQQLEQELNAQYPDLNQTPIQSNVRATFFENHRYLVLGAGALMVWSYYGHQRMSTIMNRRANLL